LELIETVAGEFCWPRPYAGAMATPRAKDSSRAKAKLAPADELKREIHAVLSPELIQTRYRAGHGSFDGYAYVAAEAYFHLASGYDAGLQPMQLKYRGRSHWWLLDPSGRVIDLTLAPRETSSFPYHRGERRTFRWTRPGSPAVPR
jgi:hypothetical protein